MRAQESARIPELDGLRGVAISMVVFFHYFVQHVEARPGSIAAYGLKGLSLSWTGVDVFFVLSGFLLGGILLDQRGAENYFRVFYLRRALRIVPAYLMFLLFFALALALFPPAAYPESRWLLDEPLPFWSYFLYLQNFFMATEGRFGPNFGAVTWSLAVEEQFYLLFPLLVYGCPPRRIRTVLLILICAAPLLRVALYFAAPGGALAGFVLLPSRWDSLLLGALAAWTVRQDAAQHWVALHATVLRWLLVAAIAGIALFPVLGFSELSLGMAVVGHIWIAVTVALLLILMARGQAAGIARCLSIQALRFIGRISYTVYLLHQPVRGSLTALVFGGNLRVGSAEEFGLAVAALVLTVLIASASWYGYEARLVRLGHRARYRQPAMVS